MAPTALWEWLQQHCGRGNGSKKGGGPSIDLIHIGGFRWGSTSPRLREDHGEVGGPAGCKGHAFSMSRSRGISHVPIHVHLIHPPPRRARPIRPPPPPPIPRARSDQVATGKSRPSQHDVPFWSISQFLRAAGFARGGKPLSLGEGGHANRFIISRLTVTMPLGEGRHPDSGVVLPQSRLERRKLPTRGRIISCLATYGSGGSSVLCVPAGRSGTNPCVLSGRARTDLCVPSRRGRTNPSSVMSTGPTVESRLIGSEESSLPPREKDREEDTNLQPQEITPPIYILTYHTLEKALIFTCHLRLLVG